jgi:hypothetical protein
VTVGGTPVQSYDLFVCLDGPQVPGLMDITRGSADGGIFQASIPVQPLMVFTPVGGGAPLVLQRSRELTHRCSARRTQPG